MKSDLYPELRGYVLKSESNLGEKILNWYTENARTLPWRQKQSRKNPYKVWVSEIMLQQTTIKVVVPAYLRFLKSFPTVNQLAAAQEEGVKKVCAGLGYYRRFHYLHQAARLLVKGTHKKVIWPNSYDSWLELPGVGPYTAAAVSSIAFDEPKAVVDGNVERVLCRLLDIRLPPNLPVLKPLYHENLETMLVRERPGEFNQAIMEMGQTICTIANPSCNLCPVKQNCLAFERASQKLAPQKKIKKKPINISLMMEVPIKNGLIGLWRRPPTARFLKGSLGFPTFLEANEAMILDGTTTPSQTVRPILGTFKHNITHHKMMIQVSSGTSQSRDLKWLTPKRVSQEITTSLDQKCWETYRSTIQS